MTNNWGGCWNENNPNHENAIRELYGLPHLPPEREYQTEEEMDYFEELSFLQASPTWPTKPTAYKKMYRLGMTERKIKRRLFQLTKRWTGSQYCKGAYWNGQELVEWDGMWEEVKWAVQPHRMHKKYAYESEEYDDWNYYAYLYYNRVKEKERDRREEHNSESRWYYYDEPLTCDCCNEDTWGRYEGSYYYEVDSYYWQEWKRGWWEDSVYDDGWEHWPVYFDKQENPLFYRLDQRIHIQEKLIEQKQQWRLYYHVSKGEEYETVYQGGRH